MVKFSTMNRHVDQLSVERQVHGQLVIRARKRFGDSPLMSKLLVTPEYDPVRPTHNFDNVFFEARPNRGTGLLLSVLATAIGHKSPRGIRRALVEPFKPQLDEIAGGLEKRKLAIFTGHQTLFEPAFAALGLQRALAGHTGRPYGDLAKATHLMAARALAVTDVLGRWPLTRVGQHLTNVYYTFPSSDNYRDGSIPADFQKANNARMLTLFAEQTDQPDTIAAMAASATTDKFDKDLGKYVIQRVKGDETRGTMGVLLQGWDVLPVGGIYKHGLQVVPGEIIPAEEVTVDRIHAAMEDVVVASRNQLGVPAVYAQA